MLRFNGVHHIAVLCSDYEKSKDFYTRILGLEVVRETYRADRQSYKLDLAHNGRTIIELFSFPSPPQRLTHPEATGLRHLAFEVDNIEDICRSLDEMGVEYAHVRIDMLTGKQFTFISDPDELPIEFYEK